MPGVVLVNASSGSGGPEIDALRDLGLTVVTCQPDEVAEQVQAALDGGVPFVGVAGGDGTVRAVAEQLVGTSMPLLVVPAGTRNHFAKDVGIADIEAVAAAIDGAAVAVDVGRVNGKCFVNNSSIGVYPKIVIRREVHEKRVPKRVANLIAAWEQLRHGRRIEVEIDGEPHMAWMVFVGNGPYGAGLLDLADRDALDEHVLDLRVVRADRPLARLRVIGALALGRLARSPLVVHRRCRAVTVALPGRDEVDVALDGEVERLQPPLQYESLPAALEVLTPPATSAPRSTGSD